MAGLRVTHKKGEKIVCMWEEDGGKKERRRGRIIYSDNGLGGALCRWRGIIHGSFVVAASRPAMYSPSLLMGFRGLLVSVGPDAEGEEHLQRYKSSGIHIILSNDGTEII